MRITAKKLLALGLIFSFANTYAKTINLYETPKPDAKIVGTIDAAKGITVIFAPKNSAYLKVGDPSNGNVGWIKHSDIKHSDQVTFTHSMIQDGGSTHTYQFVEYAAQPMPAQQSQQIQPQNTLQPMTREQMAQEQARQAQELQKKTQDVQNLMNKTYSDMLGLFFKLGEQPAYKPPIVTPEGAYPHMTPPSQQNVGGKPQSGATPK